VAGCLLWKPASRNQQPFQLDFETRMFPMVCGIIPECGSASLRYERSPSPESRATTGIRANVFFNIIRPPRRQNFLLVGVNDLFSGPPTVVGVRMPPEQRLNMFAVFGPPRKVRCSRRPRQPEVGRNPLTG
jgi:hypothetical protein